MSKELISQSTGAARHLQSSLLYSFQPSGFQSFFTMRFLLGAAALVAAIFAPAVHGAPPVSPHDMSLRDVDMDLAPRASTCNTPSNRACWTTGFDISTDYETSTPVTGVTRTVSYPETIASPYMLTHARIVYTHHHRGRQLGRPRRRH
jgi:hypothetical protein